MMAKYEGFRAGMENLNLTFQSYPPPIGCIFGKLFKIGLVYMEF